MTDLEPLLAVLIAAHAELGSMPFDAAKTRAGVVRLIEAGTAVILEDEGGIAGTIAVEPQELWYSRDAFLATAWLVVRPDRRGKRVLFRLFGAARDIARHNKMPLAIGVHGARKLAERTRVFMRRGGVPFATMLMWR